MVLCRHLERTPRSLERARSLRFRLPGVSVRVSGLPCHPWHSPCCQEGQCRGEDCSREATDAVRILIVEDNADIGGLLDFVRELGHAGALVPSAEAALARLRSDRPDLVLLDFRLPGMSGLVSVRSWTSSSRSRSPRPRRWRGGRPSGAARRAYGLRSPSRSASTAASTGRRRASTSAPPA